MGDPDDEMAWRVPPGNRMVLEIPLGGSIFEATEDGRRVDAVVYHVPIGRVLIGRAMTHQTLINRYAPAMQLDDCVRGDIFTRPARLEMDSFRAAVAVDPGGIPFSGSRALRNIFDAVDAFRAMGLPDTWMVVLDGEEIER